MCQVFKQETKLLIKHFFKVPLIVRLEGTNVDNAKQIVKDSGLDIVSASDLDDAARKAVSMLN